MTDAAALHVEFCDAWTEVEVPGPFSIGREGDLPVDDNPYLHRELLRLTWDRLWWLANTGSALSATISDGNGTVHAWLAPGGALPVMFAHTEVRFSAGPTNYCLALHLADPVLASAGHANAHGGTTTITPVALTLNQRLLVVALAESALRQGAGRTSTLPASKEAAARLGWTTTKFNRQLDSVCQKLGRAGVTGLHGGTDQLASNRRARLVEYALAVRLVTSDDLSLLD